MINLYEEISKLPILDIAEKLGIVVKKGMAMCFRGHDRKTPSLSISSTKNLFHCFSCDVKGSNFQLVRNALKKDNAETFDWFIANYFPQYTFVKSHKNKAHNKISKRIVLQPEQKRIEEEFFKPNPLLYQWILDNTKLMDAGKNYLTSRGFEIETISKLNITEINNPFNFFTLLKSKWDLQTLAKAGIVKFDIEHSIYKLVWWKPVILFPFYDFDMNLIYLQARHISQFDQPKYVNLKGLSKPLYNLQILNKTKYGSEIFFFEGVTDAITAIQKGFNAIGVLGALGFRDEWAQLFTNYLIRVVPDNDLAGQKFARSISDAFNKIGKHVQIQLVPNNKDFSEFILKSK